MIHIKERERVVNNHFYHMVHKKEEGTYHCIEKLMKEMLVHGLETNLATSLQTPQEA